MASYLAQKSLAVHFMLCSELVVLGVEMELPKIRATNVMVLLISWHETSVLCSRNWRIHMPWPYTFTGNQSQVMFITNSLRQFQWRWQKSKLHPSHLAPLLHATHSKISLSLTASTWLVRINFLDFLQCPTFMATSSAWADLPVRNSPAGVTYMPCPSVSAKKRTDCHGYPGGTSVTPGRAAQAVVPVPQPLPVVAAQQRCPVRASQSSVTLCTVVTRTISERFSAVALFSIDGGSSITGQTWLALQHKLSNSDILITTLVGLGTASGRSHSPKRICET